MPAQYIVYDSRWSWDKEAASIITCSLDFKYAKKIADRHYGIVVLAIFAKATYEILIYESKKEPLS